MKVEHLSHSQMATLYRCGEQYRRRYVMGERVPPGIALLRGRATHRATEANLIAKMNEGALLELDAVRQAAADAFDESTQDEYVIDGEYEGMEIAEALGTAKDEAVSLAGLHAEKVAPEIDPTGVEVRIEIPPSEALPTRFVAVLDTIDGEVVVRDVKTARKSPPKTVADDSDQLTSYDLAYRARYGKPPAGLRLDHLIRTPGRGDLKHVAQETQRTKSDLAVFVRRANAAVQMIEREVFLPAPADSWVCSRRFCGYADSCPFFRDGRSRPAS